MKNNSQKKDVDKSTLKANSDKKFMKNVQKRKAGTSTKKSSGNGTNKKKVILIISYVLLVLVSIVALILFAWEYMGRNAPDTGDDKSHFVGESGEKYDREVNGESGDGYTSYTFLATGLDKEEGLTDVIMVAKYDMVDKNVNIMSIPRDTYVKYNSTLILDKDGDISKKNFGASANSGGKINSVYSRGKNFGYSQFDKFVSETKGKSDSQIEEMCEKSILEYEGERLDLKTFKSYINEVDKSKKSQFRDRVAREFGIKYLGELISYDFCIPIDFYAQVNIQGFRNVVDAIGGVDVVIQEDMYYKDPLQDLYIDLKKGPQHLDGKKAEQFVRFRYGYASADIGRIDAQKIFMTAFIDKVFSWGTVTKLPALITVVKNNLTTDLSFDDTLYFAKNALELDMNNIKMMTMPGVPYDIAYYSASKAELLEMVNTYFNCYDKEILDADLGIIQLSNSKPVGNEVLSAGDIKEDEPDLDFLGSKPSSNSSSGNNQKPAKPSDEVTDVPPAENYENNDTTPETGDEQGTDNQEGGEASQDNQDNDPDLGETDVQDSDNSLPDDNTSSEQQKDTTSTEQPPVQSGNDTPPLPPAQTMDTPSDVENNQAAA